jgi:hypothetical protein
LPGDDNSRIRAKELEEEYAEEQQEQAGKQPEDVAFFLRQFRAFIRRHEERRFLSLLT